MKKIVIGREEGQKSRYELNLVSGAVYKVHALHKEKPCKYFDIITGESTKVTDSNGEASHGGCVAYTEAQSLQKVYITILLLACEVNGALKLKF